MHDKRSYTVTVERRTGSPFWQARMYLEGEGGEPRRWSTKIRIGKGNERKESERAAQRKAEADAVDIAVKAGKVDSAEDKYALSVCALAMLQFKRINARRRKRAVEALGQNLDKHVLPYFGEQRDIRTVRRPELESFKTHLIQLFGETTSVNNNLTAIRQVLKHAKFVLELLDDVPTIENIQLDTKKPDFMVLEPDVAASYLDHFLPEEHQARDFNLFLIHTGLRRTEALSIRWDWIDWKARHIVIPGEVRKGGKKRRVPVPLTDDIYALLEERRKRPKQPSKGRVWWQRSKKMDYDRMRREAAERAGIAGYRHHDARHTLATHMSRDGATPLDLMDQFGWVSPAMAPRYSHPTHERVHAWAQRMGSKFSTGNGATGSPTSATGSATGSEGSRGEDRTTSGKRAKRAPVEKTRKSGKLPGADARI